MYSFILVLILLTLYLERNTSWKPVLKLSSNSNMVTFLLHFNTFVYYCFFLAIFLFLSQVCSDLTAFSRDFDENLSVINYEMRYSEFDTMKLCEQPVTNEIQRNRARNFFSDISWLFPLSAVRCEMDVNSVCMYIICIQTVTVWNDVIMICWLNF